MNFKYVIFDHHLVVLIPRNAGVKHSDVHMPTKEATSAGFVAINNGEVETYGTSVSLGMSPRRSDAQLIKRSL